MTENFDETREAAKQAVSEDDIHEKVKNITLNALSNHQLDTEAVKQVIQAVVEGVTEGVGDSSEKLKPKLKESLSGIDDALSKSAIAMKLTVEEAAGRAEQFAKEDLNNALNELRGLENTFIDTINTVAKQTSELTSAALTELAEHLKNSGTSSGKEALSAINSINNALLDVGKETISELAHASQTAGERFTHIASGILSGMAEAIKPKGKSD